MLIGSVMSLIQRMHVHEYEQFYRRDNPETTAKTRWLTSSVRSNILSSSFNTHPTQIR